MPNLPPVPPALALAPAPAPAPFRRRQAPLRRSASPGVLALGLALLLALGQPVRGIAADTPPAADDDDGDAKAIATAPAPDRPAVLAAGQIWRAKARPEDPEALLTIVMVEDDPALGRIIHVSVNGLRLKNPAAETGLTELIRHLPFSEAALQSSIGEYIGATDSVPDFRAAYLKWRVARDAGKAGVFEVPLSIVLSAMQGALLDAAKAAKAANAAPAQP